MYFINLKCALGAERAGTRGVCALRLAFKLRVDVFHAGGWKLL